MKPDDGTPQNWQQPAESLPQAPYQAPVAPVVPVTPAVDASPVAPVTVSQPDPTTATSDEVPSTVTEETNTDQASPSDDDTALLRWQATEYLHHDRSALWYTVLSCVVVLFIILAIFVFHSVTFAILIPVMLVALVVYVRRPPSILNYILSRKGLHVNDRLYTYDQFKAFGVVTHDGTHSVVLLPRKRFQVSQTVYFPEEVGESLVDMIAARLPMQEVHLDPIDRLLKKLRI